MLAILGEIEFEITGGLAGMELSQASDFAEHALIQGKPLLETVGDALDDIRLNIELHPALGDVAARVRALQAAMQAHQPLAFVLGNGEFLGAFVMTELSQNHHRTFADGGAFSATLSVTLRQWAGDFETPPPAPALADSEQDVQDAQPDLMNGETRIKTTAMQALEHAKTAARAVQAGVDAIQSVRQMDIASALQQLPALGHLAGRAIPALSGLADTAAALQGGFAAAAQLVQLGTDALAQVQTVHALLTGHVDSGNVLAILNTSGQSLESVLSLFEQGARPLAQLAGAIATRRI